MGYDCNRYVPIYCLAQKTYVQLTFSCPIYTQFDGDDSQDTLEDIY
jgi:hypothetical protein